MGIKLKNSSHDYWKSKKRKFLMESLHKNVDLITNATKGFMNPELFSNNKSDLICLFGKKRIGKLHCYLIILIGMRIWKTFLSFSMLK